MANTGFNAASDIFSLGTSWKPVSLTANKSHSVAECKNSFGDIVARDVYGETVAPSVDYELVAAVTSLPALGTVVSYDSKKIAISSITIRTSMGAAPTATVSGTRVEDGASTGRTYALPTLAISTRHRAQDITSEHATEPSTLSEATFTFTCDVTTASADGEIVSSDVSNGRYEASFTNTLSSATASVTLPSVSGTKVLSSPETKTFARDGYITTAYTATDSLTGSEPSSST